MKHIILLAATLSMFIPLYTLFHVEPTLRASLSRHIARRSRTTWLAGISILVVCIAVLLWYFMWFLPTFDAPLWLSVVMAVTCGLAAMTAIAPYERSKQRDLIHDIVAYSYVGVIIIAELGISLTIHNLQAQIIIYLAVLLQLSIIMLVAVSRYARRMILVAQIVYITCFGVCLLAVTYMV